MRRILQVIFWVGSMYAMLMLRQNIAMRFYPVVMNALSCSVFLISLMRRRPICLVCAQRLNQNILPSGAEKYCTRLTVIWAILLAILTLVSLATVWMSDQIWLGWNCAGSYIVMGSFALIEWLYRLRRFRLIFHTSGSTATPKTIIKPFSTLVAEVKMHCRDQRDNIAQNPLIITTIEPQHMFGQIWRVQFPRASGLRVVDETVRTPEQLIALMESAEKVFLITTPSFLDRITSYAGQYCVPQNCIEIITSGALLTEDVSRRTQKMFGIAPREIFGSTETGGVAWRRQSEFSEWRVLKPVQVRQNEEGRIVVRSPFVFSRQEFTMGDGVEMLDANCRSFKLLGRMDRLVKIAEQRVSLPEMEAKTLAACEELREVALCAYESERGPQLGLVGVIKPNGEKWRKKEVAQAIRSKLISIFPAGTVPRKFRFVYELPHNPQGKILTSELREILAQDFPEPLVLSATRNNTEFVARIVFDAEAPYFDGHFEGLPVLPGVVQLGFAKHFAEKIVLNKLQLHSVTKMKFVKVIRPDEVLELRIQRKPDTLNFIYTYSKNNEVCSSGELKCDGTKFTS